MRPGLLLPAVIVLLLAVVLVLLFPGDEDADRAPGDAPTVERATGEGEPPELIGHPSAAAPGAGPGRDVWPGPPRLRTLEGRVLTAAGEQVAAAHVYLVPKNARGLTQSPPSLVRVDEEGRWELCGVDPTGHWIGVRGPVGEVAFADGDAHGDEPVELRLEDPGVLAVSTMMAQGVFPEDDDVSVQCRPPEDLETWNWPGPAVESRWDVEQSLQGTGDVIVHLPTTGSVRVCVVSDVVYADPREILVGSLPGAAHFDLYPTCSLTLKIVDEEGAPLRTNIGLQIENRETGLSPWEETSWALTVWPRSDGSIPLDRGVRPGTYVVKVNARGFEDAEREVSFESPGEEKTLEIPLTSAPEIGVMRLEVNHEGESAGGGVFVIAVRPSAGGPWRSKPATNRVGRGTISTAVEIEGLREGRWDVMVWLRPTDRVGYAMNVHVHGGVVTDQEVRAVPGVLVAIPKEVGTNPSVRLAANPLGRLPLIRFWGTSYSVTDLEIESVDPQPGPYPFRVEDIDVRTGDDATR